MFLGANKIKRGKTVQNKSFLNKIKGSCQFYNLIIIKGRHITL